MSEEELNNTPDDEVIDLVHHTFMEKWLKENFIHNDEDFETFGDDAFMILRKEK